MITVTVEVSEGFTKRRVRCTAPSIERAVELARGPHPSTRVARVIFPIDPDTFFAIGDGISDEPARPETRQVAGARP